MKKVTSTITPFDVFTESCGSRKLENGQVIELKDSGGKIKGLVKITAISSTSATVTIRDLYWYERVWCAVRRSYYNRISWLRWKRDSYSGV